LGGSISVFFIVTPIVFKKDIKRAFELGEAFGNEVKINGCGFYGGMAKEPFNGVNISTLVKQMGSKAVPKRMDPGAFFYTGFFFAMVKAL
jgi:hypothetical protein